MRLSSFRGCVVMAAVVLLSSSTSSLVLNPRRAFDIRGGGSTTIAKRSHTALHTAVPADGEELRGGGESGGTATIPTEVFNLVKSIVGAGVLSLPAGIAAYGNAPGALVPAIFLIALMGSVSAYTFGLIGRVCQRTNTNTYSAAWDAAVGSKSSWIVALSCFIDCFAGNLSYSMILADTFQNLLMGLGVAVTRTQSLLGVTGGVLLPLCLLKNLSSLAPFSLVGIIGMLYTTLAMGIRYFGGAYAKGGAFVDTQLAKPIFGAAGASSIWSPNALILTCMLSNAYIAHFIAPNLLRDLKNNTQARFHKMIGWSFGTAVLIYSLITSFGFLMFGAASNGNVLNNFAPKDPLMAFSRIAVAISITCSYPLLFVGTRDGVLDLMKATDKQRNSNGFVNKLTLGLLAIVTAAASQLTNLGLVASVGGATFGTALVFVYPVIMFLKSQKGQKTKETIPAALIGVLGVAMGTIGTVLSLQGADL